MTDQNVAVGMLMSVLLGLIIFGIIMSVGALTMTQVQNITVSTYMVPSYNSCLQSNGSNGTCSLRTGYIIPEYSGNWTMGDANSLTANFSDGVLTTMPICGNTTNNDVQCNATWFFRNSNTSLRGASSILITVYNYTGTGAYQNYTVALPDSCTYNSGSPLYFAVIRAVKNTSTSALNYYCNSTSGWQNIATYRNATATVASGWYPLGSEPWLNWSVYNGTVIRGDALASTFSPVQSSLDASITAGSWLSTVVVVVIAGAILSLLVLGFRVFGGAREGGV